MLFGFNAQPFTVHKLLPELINTFDVLYISPSGVVNSSTGKMVSVDLGLPPKYSAAKLGDFVYGTATRDNTLPATFVGSSYNAMTALQPTIIQLSENTRQGTSSRYEPSGPFVFIVLSELWDYTLGSLVNGRLRRIVQPPPPVPFTIGFTFETGSLAGSIPINMEMLTAPNIGILGAPPLRPGYVLVYRVVGDRPPSIGWLPFNLSSHGLAVTDRVVFNNGGFGSMAVVSRQSSLAEVGAGVYRRIMTYIDPITAELIPRAAEMGFYLQ